MPIVSGGYEAGTSGPATFLPRAMLRCAVSTQRQGRISQVRGV